MNRTRLSTAEILAILIAATTLSALAILGIRSARERSCRAVCGNNLKLIGVALHTYFVESHGRFPYACVGNAQLPPEKRWSWYVSIGQYTGHYGTPIVDLHKAWDPPELRPLKLHTWINGPPPDAGPDWHEGYYELDVPLYAFPEIRCPSSPLTMHADGQPFTSYVAMAGLGDDAVQLAATDVRAGMWAYGRQTTADQVVDGFSNTLLVIETSQDNGCWLAGGRATARAVTDSPVPHVATDGQFGGLHPGGAIALFADGSVAWLQGSIAPDVFAAYSTICGKEPVDSRQHRTPP